MSKESTLAMPPPPPPPPLPPGLEDPRDLPALLPGMSHDGSLTRKRIHYEDDPPLKAMSKESSKGSFATTTGSKIDSAAADWFYVQFEREEKETDLQVMMGSAWRSCITGQVFTKQDIDYPTYKFADFWTRSFIKGSIPALQEDKYVFRPVLLAYRTWMYHHFFASKAMVQGGGSEWAVIANILSHRTVDLELWAGRWSPLMVYAPLMLLLSLTGDIYAVLAGLIVNWLLWLVATSTNTPVMHRYHRVFSFPLRLIFLLFILMRFGGAKESLGILAFVLVIMTMLAEMVAGDVMTILSYRLECTYEIVRVLPNRVFICRRHGASGLEEETGPRGKVKEEVSGFAQWSRDMHLIADMGGMLVELRPMRHRDWIACHEEFCMKGTSLPFVSLNIFDEVWPSAMKGDRGKDGISIVRPPHLT